MNKHINPTVDNSNLTDLQASAIMREMLNFGSVHDSSVNPLSLFASTMPFETISDQAFVTEQAGYYHCKTKPTRLQAL